jgi:hypothetical protein
MISSGPRRGRDPYEGYETARFTTDLAAEAVAVAQENYRVQDVRYRAAPAPSSTC